MTDSERKPPTQQEILQELLDREESKDDLLRFTEYTHPKWTSGEHHRRICQELQAVERGEVDRLMIFAPPRHSKSELASRRFPAWYLGRNPAAQIICCAYSDDLASDIGADVRDIMWDPSYRNVFPKTTLRTDTTAAGRWRTEQGGIYVAAGVGGPIVGRGANLAVIDDPIKNREEADSERIRDKVWKWYIGALMTRLMPGGSIVLMMTRWHEDDLAARALQTDDWKIVELPAVTGEGSEHEQALWPEWFPMESLTRTRDVMIKGGRLREWKAQYQQKPTAEEGVFMKRAWFSRRHTTAPDNLNIYMASDFAVTAESEGRDPDFTEHGVFGVAPDDSIYVLDWWSGQTTPDVWIDVLLSMVQRWKPTAWFGEAGVIRRSVAPLMDRLCRERHVYFRQEWIASTKDKASRARSFQGLASMGRVSFPADSAWAERVIDQCIAFPSDTHDDKFDTISLLCLAIDEMRSGIVRLPTGNTGKSVDGYTELQQVIEEGWKVV
jgi:predicted phage terminase large subunit-like protein